MYSKTFTLMSAEEQQAAAELRERAESILEAQRQAAERQRLRDQFAMAALTGLTHPEDCQAGPLRMELVCKMAFAWADAMLAARR